LSIRQQKAVKYRYLAAFCLFKNVQKRSKMYIIHGAFMVHTLFAIRFIGILVRFWCGICAGLAQTFLQLFFYF
jgi:hypothetical protein